MPVVEYLTQQKRVIQIKLPDVETASLETLKFERISSSIFAISDCDNEPVTVFETANVAINPQERVKNKTLPVMEGAAVGMLVVGAGMGLIVGFAVTYVTQHICVLENF